MARILIVDDQEMMRDSLAATLVREGHEVVAAGDGQAAVTRLANGTRFDLLITDLKMPRMTGIELLAETKKLRPELPVVLMTAFATVQTAVEAMKLGAYDYIQKPFDPDDVGLVVRRALGRHRERATTPSASPQASSPAVIASSDEDLAALSYREALASARDRGSR